MSWIIFLLAFIHVYQAHSLKCTTRNGDQGFCKSQEECSQYWRLPPNPTKCGRTGLLCCPTAVSEVEPLFPTYCGNTKIYSTDQIAGGDNIQPDVYSWMASFQYGNGGTFGHCSGSVVNARYVLTAAHCVVGETVKTNGGLTGVRLGDFTQQLYCDYGSENCSFYKHFGIEATKVHENYMKDRETHVLYNDIALLRLDRNVIFGEVMRPVCLPFKKPEPADGLVLIVAGWGLSLQMNDKPSKKAVGIPLLNQTICEFNFTTLMCAAVFSKKISEVKSSCEGDSGGPLMNQFERKRMAIEGIVSFSLGNCGEFPTYFTRVRYYLDWIKENMYMF